MAIQSSTLGRFENTSGNHNKYWHIVYNKTTQEYVAKWGPIKSTKPQGSKVYTEKEAMKKIREKLNDNYYKVKGYDETIGSNSAHFIMSDAS